MKKEEIKLSEYADHKGDDNPAMMTKAMQKMLQIASKLQNDTP